MQYCEVHILLLELEPIYYRTKRGDDVQGTKTQIKLEKKLVLASEHVCSELSGDI